MFLKEAARLSSVQQFAEAPAAVVSLVSAPLPRLVKFIVFVFVFLRCFFGVGVPGVVGCGSGKRVPASEQTHTFISFQEKKKTVSSTGREDVEEEVVEEEDEGRDRRCSRKLSLFPGFIFFTPCSPL